MKKCLVLFVISLLINSRLFAQNQPYSILDNLHPVSPTALQFVKSTEIPVSEYTGLPNISIPLYEIDEDEVKVPINLDYHSNGIRVCEEASWVGLGWDMQVGSIVQTVNDLDDFGTHLVNGSQVPYTKMLPDFYYSGTPVEFPLKLHYGSTSCAYGCNGPLSVNSPTANYGYEIYTDNYVPINGYYDQHADLFSSENVDSEPDVFTANFFNHSIKFKLDWQDGNNSFIVLNKKGYKIFRINDTWRILVPSGEEYDFEQKNVTETLSSSDILHGSGSISTVYQPSTIVWMLTKIITRNKKQITFNYFQSSVVNDCFPNCTQKTLIPTPIDTITDNRCCNYHSGYLDGPGLTTTTLATRAFSREPYTYLNSIVFPNGRVDFFISDRNDLIGGKKLDSISVSANQLIKSYKFNYSYFNADGVGGNSYPIASNFNAVTLLRLKLLSIQDNSGAKHNFTYNSLSLPKKNSFATDLWGFYNGQTSNVSFVPNPTRFNKPELGNNNNNHSSNLTYAQAGILQQIRYPTGGQVYFEYELNEFDNYWVPDFISNSNSTTSGNGLRIHSITFKESSPVQSKKIIYSYIGGKAILPLSIFRHFNHTEIAGIPLNLTLYNYAIDEINGSGFFSSSPLSSINGIGYNQVIREETDLLGNLNGRQVSNYYNTPDIVTTSAQTFSQLSAVLPAMKNRELPENGTLKSVLYYNNENVLLKKVENTYYNIKSAIYYGARIFGYGSFLYWSCDVGSSLCDVVITSKNMVGYYPLFDFETLLLNKKETSYYGTDSLTIVTANNYNEYNLLKSVNITNSDLNQDKTYYLYPSDFTGNTTLSNMVAKNRLSDIVSLQKSKIDQVTGERLIYSKDRKYKNLGELIVVDKDSTDLHPGLNFPTKIIYDKYDVVNGNLLQYSLETVPNSNIWDYNKQYLIAEVQNALYTSIAYTSFEAEGTGRWKYTGNVTVFPDNLAATGNKVCNLNGSTIYRDSLSASTYIVSYYSKNGPLLVNGSTVAQQGVSSNGWLYYEHTVSVSANGTISVSGTSTIDELRLRPINAQMTTYTYSPLVGMTSMTDPAGHITYYQYDPFQRLQAVKDQSGNIIKSYDYHYKP